MQLPRLVEVEQQLYSRRVGDIAKEVARAWHAAGCGERVRGRIAITVGSRGIDNLTAIVKALADLIKQAGGKPFIIPSMGSHGGATPAGQTALLASLGVTPETVGAPIRASMATAEVGKTATDLSVYTASEALKADGIIVLNRIKQHTDYEGEHESGLAKMLAVGLGKRTGAAAMHCRRCASLREEIPAAAALLLKRLPVIAGFAILENGYHQTAEIIGLPPDTILARDKALLKRVRRNAARLPFPEIDLLIVDWIGKDVSGVAFDTHVIGRRMIWGEREFGGVNIELIAALDLTPGSRGNGLGLGLADLVTQRLVGKLDQSALRTNVLHTNFLNRAKIPVALPNDRDLFRAAFIALGEPNPKKVRIVRIANTLQLGRLWISDSLLPEARKNPRLSVIGKPGELKFDRKGDLERLAR